jgi:hypothetical protein
MGGGSRHQRYLEPAQPGPAAAPWPRVAEYEPRRPERMVLYQVVSEHWGACAEHVEEQGCPSPRFAQREVEACPRCGMLEHGLCEPAAPAPESVSFRATVAEDGTVASLERVGVASFPGSETFLALHDPIAPLIRPMRFAAGRRQSTMPVNRD